MCVIDALMFTITSLNYDDYLKASVVSAVSIASEMHGNKKSVQNVM